MEACLRADAHHLAADTEHVGFGIERHRRSKPVPSDHLIVKEGDDFSRGRGYTGVASASQSLLAVVRYQVHAGQLKVDRR